MFPNQTSVNTKNRGGAYQTLGFTSEMKNGTGSNLRESLKINSKFVP